MSFHCAFVLLFSTLFYDGVALPWGLDIVRPWGCHGAIMEVYTLSWRFCGVCNELFAHFRRSSLTFFVVCSRCFHDGVCGFCGAFTVFSCAFRCAFIGLSWGYMRFHAASMYFHTAFVVLSWTAMAFLWYFFTVIRRGLGACIGLAWRFHGASMDLHKGIIPPRCFHYAFVDSRSASMVLPWWCMCFYDYSTGSRSAAAESRAVSRCFHGGVCIFIMLL